MISFITMIGALSLVSGGMGYYFFPDGLKMALKEFINLKENGMVYPLYMNPPFTAQSNYYIYQVKNPKEFLNGEKLDVKLRGPYKFKAYIKRENIVFSAGGEKVTFDSMRRLYYDESGKDSFDEPFYMVNPVVPTVMKMIKTILVDRLPFKRVSVPIVYNAVNVILNRYQESLLKKKTPRELLGGVKVDLLEDVVNLGERFGITALLPDTPPENMFGLVHFQNVTKDVIEVYVGTGKTKDKFGEVSKFKGKSINTVWSGQCSSIEGTNGELYKPFPQKNKSLRIFQVQLCRSFDLDPLNNGNAIEIQDGLMAYEYKISDRLYQGVKNNPSNKCFCKEPKTYDCQYDGFISMGPCFLNAPVFFSRPNFKGVDKRIRAMIKDNALNESVPEKQSFYLDPISGTLLRANLNLLGAFKIVKQPNVRDLSKVQNLTYAPLFTVDEGAIVPYEYTWQLKYLQIAAGNYKQAASLAALGGSGILLVKLMMGGRSKKSNTVGDQQQVAASNNDNIQKPSQPQPPSPTPTKETPENTVIKLPDDNILAPTPESPPAPGQVQKINP